MDNGNNDELFKTIECRTDVHTQLWTFYAKTVNKKTHIHTDCCRSYKDHEKKCIYIQTGTGITKTVKKPHIYTQTWTRHTKT